MNKYERATLLIIIVATICLTSWMAFGVYKLVTIN
jgi:hypothetical protein